VFDKIKISNYDNQIWQYNKYQGTLSESGTKIIGTYQSYDNDEFMPYVRNGVSYNTFGTSPYWDNFEFHLE